MSFNLKGCGHYNMAPTFTLELNNNCRISLLVKIQVISKAGLLVQIRVNG